MRREDFAATDGQQPGRAGDSQGLALAEKAEKAAWWGHS